MKDLLNKIKKKGYWRVIIKPTVYTEDLLELSEAQKVIEEGKVQLRGWDYPHIDRTGIQRSDERSISSFCDWPEGPMLEYWRFYLSGQFVHYFPMREDLRIDEENLKIFQDETKSTSTKFLDILSTLYSVTEIFLFVSRLAGKIEKVDEWEISIELHGVNDRTLMFWDSRRILFRAYTCLFKKDFLNIHRKIKRADLISTYQDAALNTVLEIFTMFNWTEPSRDIFQEDQVKFLERRI